MGGNKVAAPTKAGGNRGQPKATGTGTTYTAKN